MTLALRYPGGMLDLELDDKTQMIELQATVSQVGRFFILFDYSKVFAGSKPSTNISGFFLRYPTRLHLPTHPKLSAENLSFGSQIYIQARISS